MRGKLSESTKVIYVLGKRTQLLQGYMAGRGVALPERPRPSYYHIACTVLLAFDIVSIPYILAWEVPFEGYVRSTVIATSILWTAEMVLTFQTAIYRNGVLEDRRWIIAASYLNLRVTEHFLSST